MCPKALRKLTFLFVAVRVGLRARSVRAGLRAVCPHGGAGCGSTYGKMAVRAASQHQAKYAGCGGLRASI